MLFRADDGREPLAGCEDCSLSVNYGCDDPAVGCLLNTLSVNIICYYAVAEVVDCVVPTLFVLVYGPVDPITALLTILAGAVDSSL
jgi:hypothetical protein